ncbi:PREDICTED: uncharacterized protein LOC108366987 [Rhagoletis zephyria]|uniref:uncharacterized protein LOC108366987 n=1 Tax=Rhagoletis zephyria TaxID=28612 RepID=UPI0008119D07|nr:PREDICTED: uncharacterized protein LOC108366987 [Rhagoletis zephyria]
MDASLLRLLAALILISLYRQAALLEVSTRIHTRNEQRSDGGRSIMLENGLTRTLKHIYGICGDRDDLFWCFKVQATRLLGRALKVQNINIVEGVTIVKKVDNETRTGRASANAELNLSNRDLENLSMKSLDALLMERFLRFIDSRQLQVNLPRLLNFSQRNGQDLFSAISAYFQQFTLGDDEVDAQNSMVEGRKKKGDDKKYLGPFIAAVMLKTAILKMAYHSIAIVAGKALIVGKIALIISAIIGLKKLVSSEGGEKTTYEIVKHPQVQHSQTYSSSHAGEYEAGHEGGSYHRSIDDEMMMQDKAYNAWVPSRVQT